LTLAAKHADERRVLTVVRYPLGGIRTYLLYNYPHLVQYGYRFTFVGPADSSFRSFREEVVAWPGTEVVEAPSAGPKCNLRRAVAASLREKRFCLIHSQGLTAAVHSVLANLRYRVPHVVTSHDVIRADQFPGMVGRVKRAVLGRVLSRADKIITVSHDAHGNHLEYFPFLKRNPEKLVTIVNGIDVGRFGRESTETPGGLRRQLGLSDEVFLMGFMGRFMEQKGFLPLVEALDRLPSLAPPRPYHLVAVGSGDCLARYRREALSRQHVAPHISFLDHVADSAPILRQLDLLVMPSLWEACPLLPMEAMCLGVPVLGSDCIGLREVLRGTPSRMACHGDPMALAVAIREALAAPWKDEARQYAPVCRQRFDVRPSAEDLLSVFARCVARANRHKSHDVSTLSSGSASSCGPQDQRPSPVPNARPQQEEGSCL
jgi:glycosyltransferase involved in cell wall biosynthesis